MKFQSVGMLMGSDDVIKSEKESLLHFLQDTSEKKLWNIFLEVQADLFFEGENKIFINSPWWTNAEKILEIGSGNGAYLSRLASKDPNKIYEGVEKEQEFVEEANCKFNDSDISFSEGDAEVLDPEKMSSYDVVLFRLTLQHLNNPRTALKYAWKYLKPNGHIVIIDSCDSARKTSHQTPCIENALEQVNVLQEKKSDQGNRRITIELLNEMFNTESDLGQLFALVDSNLDRNGMVLKNSIVFSGDEDRARLFAHMLYLLALLQKKYQIPVDWERAYEEIRGYYEDENAWLSPGLHFLVMRKKAP